MVESSSDGRDPPPDGPRPDSRGGRSVSPRLLVLFAVVATAAVGGIALLRGGVSGPVASPAATGASTVPATSGAAASTESARPGPVSSPQGAPGHGSIAVIAPSGALSLIDEDGRSVELSDGAGVAFGFPAWSPDGSRIGVVSTGATETSIAIFTVPSGAGDPRPNPVVIYRSADALPFYLYWRPDGTSLSFLAGEGDKLSLRVAPADGSAPLDGTGPGAVVRRGAPLYYDWIASNRLLLHVGSGPDAFLGEVGPDGSAVAPGLDRPGEFRAAASSADGRFIAYARGRAGAGASAAVVTSKRDGSSEHTVSVFGPAAVVFEPAGDTAALIGADKPGQEDLGLPIGPLRLVDAGSGATRRLLDGLVVGFFWSPDGRTIAALRLQPVGGATAGIPAILAAAAGAAPIAASPTPEPETEIRLLFVDVTSGKIRSQRVVTPGRRFVNEFLQYFDQYALSHRLWAPDSSALLLPLVDAKGSTRLVALPPDGGASQFTINGEAGFWSP